MAQLGRAACGGACRRGARSPAGLTRGSIILQNDLRQTRRRHSANRGQHRMAIELLTLEMFSDKIGQGFVIEEPDMPAIELTLTEVKGLPNFANAPRAPFSLLFTSHGKGVLPQRMYPLRHAALGLHSIFLVPVGRDGDKASYEAVFN